MSRNGRAELMMEKRSLSVILSKFSAEALARGKASESEHLDARLVRAARFYLHEGAAARSGWSVPSALRAEEPQGVEVALEADGALLEAFEAEAGRQGVSLSRLASQAALVYAAELDAGRITQRVLDDLDGDCRSRPG